MSPSLREASLIWQSCMMPCPLAPFPGRSCTYYALQILRSTTAQLCQCLVIPSLLDNTHVRHRDLRLPGRHMCRRTLSVDHWKWLCTDDVPTEARPGLMKPHEYNYSQG